ncbi:hypothetical protein B0A55_06737, partial [Friedmanniomyces simplex]
VRRASQGFDLEERGRSNQCPLDRSVLFSLPTAEAPLNPERTRQALVLQAIRDAGLAFDQPGRYDAFGFELTTAGMARAVLNLQQYLLGLDETDIAQASGPSLISYNYLAPRAVAMANLIPALAGLNDRPYTPSQRAAWRSIVGCLPCTLGLRNNEEVDALVLPHTFRINLNPAALLGEVDAFFADGNGPLADDLNQLLAVIAWSCVGCWFEREDRQRRQQQAERQQRQADLRRVIEAVTTPIQRLRG